MVFKPRPFDLLVSCIQRRPTAGNPLAPACPLFVELPGPTLAGAVVVIERVPSLCVATGAGRSIT